MATVMSATVHNPESLKLRTLELTGSGNSSAEHAASNAMSLDSSSGAKIGHKKSFKRRHTAVAVRVPEDKHVKGAKVGSGISLTCALLDRRGPRTTIKGREKAIYNEKQRQPR